MDKWLNLIRGLIRPYIILSGWTTGLGLGAYFAVKFANTDIAIAFVLVLTGAITAISSMYIGERAGKPKGEK